jgi:hypothetical protein
MHVWNVPGGPPSSQIEIDLIFKDLFGPAVFTHLVKTRTTLHVKGTDLMNHEGMVVTPLTGHIADIDHDRDQIASVLVDDNGFYLGDWRVADVEGVRDVILLLSSCLRFFESRLNLQFLELFSKKDLVLKDVNPFLSELFTMKISESETAKEFTKHQKSKVEKFLVKVLSVHSGLESTFDELFKVIGKGFFQGYEPIETKLKEENLFDSSGKLIEDRSHIFSYLEKVVRFIQESILKIRKNLERLDVALKTKTEVFGHQPTYVSVRADVEEIKAKMGLHPYLTVNYPDKNDKMYPVGVIHAANLRKASLGTVSLRDFCNRDEMGIPAYLDVISVIDHHKSSLTTSAPPFAIISDAQSCNALVAKQAFFINDRNSMGGLNDAIIAEQLSEAISSDNHASTRMTQKLLARRLVSKTKAEFYVHPEREFIEYLHFLYAILEDTDLLTKVTPVDVDCVVELLNRLKSLSGSKEVEIISLEDIPKNVGFPKKAAARILQNEDLYSVYRKVYDFREKEVELNMDLSATGKPSNFFADTKEQNGCCRVGQTKVFANNISFYEKKANAIKQAWVTAAERVYMDKPSIALHMHMISTIVSAEDVYKGVLAKHTHKDELWLWIPQDELAIESLKVFLNAFQASPGLKGSPIDVEFTGDRARELALIFKESFPAVPYKTSDAPYSIAIIRYNPGALNSRKAMVAPFLPR